MDHDWVWFENQIALVVEHDNATDFCELQILIEYPRKYRNLTVWVLAEDHTLSTMAHTRPCTEHTIEEIQEGVFVIDDGDMDYVPSTDESESDSEYDEDYEASDINYNDVGV
tara:strand:+ start:244 stop:579 length:336 start_codon:yes stop_codon:yes gene_type:complete